MCSSDLVEPPKTFTEMASQMIAPVQKKIDSFATKVGGLSDAVQPFKSPAIPVTTPQVNANPYNYSVDDLGEQ